MKKTIFGIILVALLVGMFSSACTRVEPGYVGIKVNMYGTQRGVEDFPIITGRVWFNPWTEDIYKFPTFMQSIVWTKDATEGSPNDDSITFNSIEGAVINCDVGLSYSFDPAKVPSIFMEFRQPAETITWGYMRSQLRDSFSRNASTMKVTEIFGSRKQELLTNVKKDMETLLGPKGFKIDMISIVGAMRVDKQVENSINAVISASQKAIESENKVRQAQAEAQQKIATADGEAQSILKVAEAQAQANALLTQSLTPALIEIKAIEKWNEIMPTITGGATPFIQIPNR